MRFMKFLIFMLMLAAVPATAAQRTIFLTFDDGPLDGTSNILSVLRAQKVPATLFMVGMHALASPARKALVVEAKSLPLLTIGNHSFTHANNRYQHFYADTEAVVADMLKANAALGLSQPPIPARLPGRNVFRLYDVWRNDEGVGLAESQRENVDFEFVAASGFQLYGWDHEWVHLNDGQPVQTVDHLISEIDHLFAYGHLIRKDKLILLMHDEMFQDKFGGVAKLTALVAGLRSRGYAFGRIDSYDAQ